jgi:palmitoyltransferase ZDHHC9/14/18
MAAASLCVFVISAATYQLLFIANQHDINRPMNGFGDVFLAAPVSFVLAIYCFILLWLVGGLTLYHCSLILRGVTTYEQACFVHLCNYPVTNMIYLDSC